MTTHIERPTATIIPFPIRARFGVSLREDSKPLVDRVALRSDFAFGGSWYHEAAIADAEPARKP